MGFNKYIMTLYPPLQYLTDWFHTIAFLYIDPVPHNPGKLTYASGF